MITRKSARWQLSADAVTPEALFLNRRRIIKAAGAVGVGLLAGCGPTETRAQTREGAPAEGEDLAFSPTRYSVDDPLTPYDAVTTYNNYYEFGLNKGDPARNAHRLTTDPWSIAVEGHANRTGTFALTDLVDFDALEERIYRLRCVEA